MESLKQFPHYLSKKTGRSIEKHAISETPNIFTVQKSKTEGAVLKKKIPLVPLDKSKQLFTIYSINNPNFSESKYQKSVMRDIKPSTNMIDEGDVEVNPNDRTPLEDQGKKKMFEILKTNTIDINQIISNNNKIDTIKQKLGILLKIIRLSEGVFPHFIKEKNASIVKLIRDKRELELIKSTLLINVFVKKSDHKIKGESINLGLCDNILKLIKIEILKLKINKILLHTSSCN